MLHFSGKELNLILSTSRFQLPFYFFLLDEHKKKCSINLFMGNNLCKVINPQMKHIHRIQFNKCNLCVYTKKFSSNKKGKTH